MIFGLSFRIAPGSSGRNSILLLKASLFSETVMVQQFPFLDDVTFLLLTTTTYLEHIVRRPCSSKERHPVH